MKSNFPEDNRREYIRYSLPVSARTSARRINSTLQDNQTLISAFAMPRYSPLESCQGRLRLDIQENFFTKRGVNSSNRLKLGSGFTIPGGISKRGCGTQGHGLVVELAVLGQWFPPKWFWDSPWFIWALLSQLCLPSVWKPFPQCKGYTV